MSKHDETQPVDPSRRTFLDHTMRTLGAGWAGLLIGGLSDPEVRRRRAAAVNAAKNPSQPVAQPTQPTPQEDPKGALVGGIAGVAGALTMLATESRPRNHQEAEQAREAAPDAERGR